LRLIFIIGNCKTRILRQARAKKPLISLRVTLKIRAPAHMSIQKQLRTLPIRKGNTFKRKSLIKVVYLTMKTTLVSIRKLESKIKIQI